MKIDYCVFPEGLLYDVENFVWVNVNLDKVVTIGITPILASIAGKLSAIKLKERGSQIEKGKSIATIESNKYFGIVRTPIRGKIIDVNESIVNRPKLANDLPYTKGWFAKIESSNIDEDLSGLQIIEKCYEKIASSIKQLRIRCFVAYPDHEMYEIGVECAATLTKLDELLSKIELGEIIHLVSDDQTADLEMIRWSEERGQSILESRLEGNLFHFIIKRIK
jgi:glycine cleavage system H lipoate-binding protein/TusA-related sulfurtransferase